MRKLFFLLLIAATVLCFCGCTENPTNDITTAPSTSATTEPTEPVPTEPSDTPSCEHVYDKQSFTEPTCTEFGHLSTQCLLCGDCQSISVAPTGHQFTDATCTMAKECQVCGFVEGEPLDHAYVDNTCSRCNAVQLPDGTRVPFSVTVRSNKGALIAGVTVTIYADGIHLMGSCVTNANGVATMPVYRSENYKIVLSNVPQGLSAKEAYTFRSTTANINLTAVAQISPDDHSKANYRVGSYMGDFTLTDTDGISYSLSTLLTEKDLVILNFWFVQCGPCKEEFPYFQEIYGKCDNLQLLALNPINSQEDIVTLRQQMGITFPMVRDTIGLSEGFQVSAYPVTVFIDKTGKIRQIDVGAYSTQQALEAVIQKFLK